MRSLFSGAMVALTAAILCLTARTRAEAENVDFLVAQASSIDVANEEIIFKEVTAQTWLDASCGVLESGEYAVQQVAVVLKGGTEPVRLLGVVVLKEIQPDTRVGDLTLLATCTVGGTVYHRFRGGIQ